MEQKDKPVINFNAPIISYGTINGDIINPTYKLDADQLNKALDEAASKDKPMTGFYDDKLSALTRAIADLAEEECFLHKKDFAVILRMIQEMNVFEKMTVEYFVSLLAKCNLSSAVMPSVSTIKAVSVSNAKHPKWRIDGASVDETKRLVALAETFKTRFLSYLN